MAYPTQIRSTRPPKPKLPKAPRLGGNAITPTYGESSASTTAGPTAANRFGMPSLPKLPAQRGSGVPGVPSVSTRNKKSIGRFGA